MICWNLEPPILEGPLARRKLPIEVPPDLILLIVVNFHLVHHLNEVGVLQLHRRLQISDPIDIVPSLQLVFLRVENCKEDRSGHKVDGEGGLAELSEPLRCHV